MTRGSDQNMPEGAELQSALQEITDVLLAVAQGNFEARAARSFEGDPLDVLAFLVNSTSEEVGQLVAQLQSEREKLQQTRDQLVMAAKLAALGQLAAGVAHELNQPLTAIRMLIEILQRRPDRKISECEKDLEMAEEAARRMARIVDSVRTFGKPNPLQRAPIHPADPFRASMRLLGDTLQRMGITVTEEIESDLPGIDADADQLSQVFINLLSNSRDALLVQGQREPRITIRITRQEERIVYDFEDNGSGIPSEHASRIFDPFFTTKEAGRGTGLGLSVSHSIVVEHGGSLRYEAAPGGGARFFLELPMREAGA